MFEFVAIIIVFLLFVFGVKQMPTEGLDSKPANVEISDLPAENANSNPDSNSDTEPQTFQTLQSIDIVAQPPHYNSFRRPPKNLRRAWTSNAKLDRIAWANRENYEDSTRLQNVQHVPKIQFAETRLTALYDKSGPNIVKKYIESV